MVDKDGNVDKNTPIIWDFDNITSMTALPIDEKTLTIRGGRFTTIANSVNINDYPYFNRGIAIRRSNVLVDGLVHLVTGEGEHGAPYSGFINVSGCAFSRFDSHMGVANATIRNSTLGHQGISIIGSGTFLIENSTINSRFLINLRPDYGSTWEGDMIIRNCVFVPRGNNLNQVSLIGGSNSGQHDFGYVCYQPERIIIENLRIEDTNHSAKYTGPSIFNDFNPKMTDETYTEKFPYIRTKEVIQQNVTTASGKEISISENPFMFKNVTVIKK